MSAPRELATCAEHGLRYDPSQHAGCIVCRRREAPRAAGDVRRIAAIAAIALVLVAGASFAAYRCGRGRVAAREQKVASERAQRQTAVSVAPAPLPSGLPLVALEEKDAYGYPKAYVDRAALRALLVRRRYDELTKYIEQLQAEFEADPTREYWPEDAGAAFESAEPELLEALDGWVAAAPNSFAPYLARGRYWVDVAYARRGGKLARDTPKSSFAAMEDAARRAWDDLERALAIRPKLVAARNAEITILRGFTKTASIERAYDAAVTSCPTCFLPRARRIVSLTPRWGGSFVAMDALARASAGIGNPRMRLIAGYVEYERARELREKNDSAGALAAIERACALGDYSVFLSERAEIQRLRGDDAAALADLDRAAAIRPGEPSILIDRAFLQLKIRHYEAAGRDLLAGLRVDPTSSDGRAIHADTVRGLIYAGWEEHRAGRRDDALRMFDLASDLDPPNAEVRWRRAAVESGQGGDPGVAVAALEQAAKESPDDFAVHKQLDDLLARQRSFDRVVAMWTDYLARNPNDGRAYLERGGAYYNMRRMKEAYADASKACELGVHEGCAHAKQVERSAN